MAAYETLVRRYETLAFRVAYLVTGSAGDAEDAAQEGFVRAYYALPRFRRGAPFRPWLMRIVANSARNRRAASTRRPTLSLDLAADRPADDPSFAPEAAALAGERQRELLGALNTLREDDRTVIACRYFLDLSEEETAATLGCPRGTVKSRLSRALRRLRLQLRTTAGVDLSGPTGLADD